MLSLALTILSLVPTLATTVSAIRIEAQVQIPAKLEKYYQDVSIHEITETHLELWFRFPQPSGATQSPVVPELDASMCSDHLDHA